MTDEPKKGIDGLPAALLHYAEQLCRQAEVSCKAGGQPAIEDYLAGPQQPERPVPQGSTSSGTTGTSSWRAGRTTWPP
jgi:hypothetical protein